MTTRERNLAMILSGVIFLGIVGTAGGLGGSFSSTMAGFAADHFGSHAAFLCLAVIAAVGFCLLGLMMPETRDLDEN